MTTFAAANVRQQQAITAQPLLIERDLSAFTAAFGDEFRRLLARLR